MTGITKKNKEISIELLIKQIERLFGVWLA